MVIMVIRSGNDSWHNVQLYLQPTCTFGPLTVGLLVTLSLSHDGVCLAVCSIAMMDQLPTFGSAYQTVGCCYRAVGVTAPRDQCSFIGVLINAHFVSTAQRAQTVTIRRTPQQSQRPPQCLVNNRCTDVGARR